MTKIIPCILLIGIVLTLSVRADSEVQYSFSAIWKVVRERSPNLSASNHELESARINELRMSRHWYPRVFAQGRVFSTNDPSLTFISLLGQRQIAVSDFAPGILNQPGSGFFEQGTLGFDLPLFEGGSKVAAAQAAVKMTEAKALELQSAEVTQYLELAQTYSSILSLQKQRNDLQRMVLNVEETLSHYKIGMKSNPVGYSGLLGLKNLRNRLEGLLVENSGKTTALKERVRIQAGNLPESWSPQPANVKEFLALHLNAWKGSRSQGPESSPSSVQAMRLASESLEKMKDAEQARFLPKIGLYGTGDLYGGNRGSATSFSGGAFLQWDLFSAQNFGAISQAEHTALAAQARADGMSERTQIERANARQLAESLEKNLLLMEESAKLLDEQTATTQSLFQNGSINALQLTEVLARRIDLLVNRSEAELSLAQARVTILVNSSVEGVPHED